MSDDERKQAALVAYRKKLLEHKEIDTRVRSGLSYKSIWDCDSDRNTARENIKTLKRDYEKSEDDLKALQSVGQIIGEVLKQLDDERCESVLSHGTTVIDIQSSYHPSYCKGIEWATLCRRL